MRKPGAPIEAPTQRLALREILGLSPWRQRLGEAALAVRGDAFTPPSRANWSTLKILQPRLALALWRGHRPFGRDVPIYNLFNRTPTPEADGWSLRKDHVRDFRGGTLTYNSHNATDFATPPGTVVVAAAPARVALQISEYNRGGLKLLLDHGAGLMTTYVHLARTLVVPGDVVARGQPIALSGASGMNFPMAMFCDPPHLHFGTWHDGAPVDPYAVTGETPLWRGDEPTPHRAGAATSVPPADFDHDAITATIDACRDPAMTLRLRALPDADERAAHVIFAVNYYPTRFPLRPRPYRSASRRQARLDLPFLASDYDGATMALEPLRT